MKKITICLLVCCALLVAIPAMADSFKAMAGHSYLGLNYLAVDTKNPQSNADFSLDALSFNFGRYLTDFFALEGRLGLGLGEDTYTAFGTSLDYRISFLSGLYIRGDLPIGRFRPYAMFGFSYLEIKANGTLLFFPVNGYEYESDVSYGGGLDVRVTEKIGLNIEYMQLIDSSRIDAESLAAGIKFYF